MAVDLYLYDERKTLLRPILWGVQKLIHDERDYLLTAEILNSCAVRPGQFLGFTCDDGRFRLFLIETAAVDVSGGYTIVTATEAAVAELARRIVRDVRLEGAYADEAAAAALSGSGFVIGKTARGRKGDVSKYYATRWKALREIEAVCNVRILPYFTTEAGRITGKVVDIEERTYRRSGRILQKETDATSVQVTYSGTAVARMYGKGKTIGTEDPPSCVSFADVVWSKAAGDPMDKPEGQEYLEDPEVLARGIEDEDVYENKNITDPAELLSETYEALMERRKPKVTGVATAFDVSYLPGYEHKNVRLYDILDVPTEDGSTVEGIVIDIQRNYIARERTQIVLGEESESEQTSIVKQVAALKSETVRLRGSSGAAASRYIENKHLIELNANRIVMNAEKILAQAEHIRLEATKIDEVTRRVTSAELELYGDGTTARAGLIARVDDNEAALILQADDLGTLARIKADVTYVNKLVADEIAAALGEFNTALTNTINTNQISVKGTAEVGALRLAYDDVSKETVKVIKSISGLSTSEVTMLAAGTGGEETASFYQRGALFQGTAYDTVETRTYYKRSKEAVDDAYHRSSSRVKLQGTKYGGKLYDADGVLVNGSTSFYLGDGDYVYRATDKYEDLYEDDGEDVVTVGIAEHTTALYQPGTKVSITTREVTALTV